MRISQVNREEFQSKGWTIARMGFSQTELNRYRDATNKIKDKAISKKYQLTRIWHPHLLHKNIAGVESPFNKEITNECVEEFFSKLQIGKALSELLGWQTSYLHLARLFTMENYNYMGDWHRDYIDWDGNLRQIQTIQVAIYMQDQPGFRIMKYTYDRYCQKGIGMFVNPPNSPALPLKCSKEYYDETKGEAGTVLFFAPGILHQGNSSTNRLDYHMRFSCKPLTVDGIETSNTVVNDYLSPEFYLRDFDANKDSFSSRTRSVSIQEKARNSINYYTGSINLARYFLHGKKPRQIQNKIWQHDYSSNTFFQNLFND